MVETVSKNNRSAGTNYLDYLDEDTHPVRDIMRTESPMSEGPTIMPADVYFSREIFDQEVENIWKKTWQLACHEDEMRNIGDHVVYDIATLSFLIVKTGEEEYRAFHNVCLHRGRQLCDHDGREAHVFRCTFHGWAWNIDGSINEIPCEWDFPSLNKEKYSLPEIKLGRWGGFIFINPDVHAEPLADYLGTLTDHFTLLPFEKRYRAVNVSKVLRCNWKVAQEAFMESYHVAATHPVILDTIGDANTKYDVFGNFSRAMSAQQVESPHIRPYTAPEDARLYTKLKHPITGFTYERGYDGLVHLLDRQGNTSKFTMDGSWVEGPVHHADPNMCNWIGGKQLPDSEDLPLPRVRDPGPGETKRSIAAAEQREVLRPILGDDADNCSDAELIDSIYYSVFPNFHPWGSFNPIMYRFRPSGDNPQECIHDVWYMVPSPDGESRPDPAPVHNLGPDADYTEAPELGMLAKVFNQDVHNMPKVQKGLRALRKPEVIFADYGETKIRHFYENYKKRMDIDC